MSVLKLEQKVGPEVMAAAVRLKLGVFERTVAKAVMRTMSWAKRWWEVGVNGRRGPKLRMARVRC